LSRARKTIDSLPIVFKDVLFSMYSGQEQYGTDGKTYKLDISTSILPEQGMYIYNLCKKIKPKKTLEIGFAYGFSTIYFLSAIHSNTCGYHTAIDPFELSYWHGVGLKKVNELKMDSFFRFMPQFDYTGVADLINENQKFDVIFIDGDHRFDYIFLDFMLADQVISKNGYIIFHDLWMNSTQKVVKFIKANRPDYEAEENTSGLRMMVFSKKSEDSRPWDNYESF